MNKQHLLASLVSLSVAFHEPVFAKNPLLNVSYGNDAKQKMDIYLPSVKTPARTLILIHGGSWSNGDKADFTPYISQLQQKLPGYAIFNLNYRLAGNGTNLFPAQENDISLAVSHIYSKRKQYNLSGQFVYMGGSAGAHLALLQGYKYDEPVKPLAIVSFFAPTDLTALFNSNPLAGMALSRITGTTPAANPDLYKQSSPANFIKPGLPPTILLHGGADPLVPPAQTASLKAALDAVHVPNEYVFYPAEKHGWRGATMADSFDRIAQFLEEYVQ